MRKGSCGGIIMNLFKKYVTSVLWVAIVATSCSPIQAIDLNYWLDRARSGASQVCDVLKRKKVWVPIVATTGMVLCLLKMTFSGKKIWQKKIDSAQQDHENLCNKIKDLDSKSDNLFIEFRCTIKKATLLISTMYPPSLTDSFLTGLLDGVRPMLDPETGQPVAPPALGRDRLITNPMRGFVNCTVNVSQRLALRLTDINGEIDEQKKRIESTLMVLLDLGKQVAEKKEGEHFLSQKELTDSEKNALREDLDQLQVSNEGLVFNEHKNLKSAKTK